MTVKFIGRKLCKEREEARGGIEWSMVGGRCGGEVWMQTYLCMHVYPMGIHSSVRERWKDFRTLMVGSLRRSNDQTSPN